MGLIPEEWFIRRSTPTGQETFFRRDQIIPRMEQITERSASLGDLAQAMNPESEQVPEPVLVIRGRYGVHRFPLQDLEAVSLVRGEEQLELLENLKGGFEHE